MESAKLLERLSGHRTLGIVPRAELEWLVAAGAVRTLQPGDVLTTSEGPVPWFVVVFDGHLSIRVDSGAGPRIVMEWRGGDVTGVLPYSRMRRPPGAVIAEEPSTILTVEASELPRMTRECPELTAVLVHVMLDRARVFKSSELLDEKMASLGRLAAGLAHELNNPASAVARSAKMLVTGLTALDMSTKQFCALDLSDAQCLAVAAFRDEGAAVPANLSPLEREDVRDAIDDWLAARGVAGVDTAPLVDAGLRPADLDRLSALVGSDKLDRVLEYISSGRTVRQLATEIDIAASRIHSLVAAVKGFTYLNQQATLQPIAIGRGLADTVTVLRPKARANSVEVDVSVPADLPAVDGYGGELNQVWANLVDNAIDAAPGGRVRIEASAADGKVTVRVIDNGHGIPEDVLGRIFDPFFTTKDVGHGTGLGLDIARRIVQRHRGAIDVSSGTSGTEFRVTLPVSSLPAAAHSEGTAS